jgi:hypothetical protein
VVEIEAVKLSKAVCENEITLIFKDGKEIVINEKDYPCDENGEEKFKI